MNAVFGEIGKRLGEKWVLLLSLPGVLFVSLLAGAVAVGDRDWTREAVRRELLRSAERWWERLSVHPAAALLFLAGVLVAAYAVALLAQVCGIAVRACWLAAVPFRWPLFWLTRLRRRVWRRHHDKWRRATTDQGRAEAAARRNAVSLAPPACPTWMADRMAALATRVRGAYGLDVSFSWPALRTLLPLDLCGAVDAAQAAFERSARLAGWGVLYLGTGCWLTVADRHGWPLVLLGAASAVTGWAYGRASAGALAALVETSYDLTADQLVAALVGRPAPAQGEIASETLRKGA
ncbi:hypothetical protein ACFRSX_29350 [Streptomyces goshikiensis]|uniref:hypothetical protein n=1 Tax=Streptomyces TaxID=1883 RepID=UPI000C27183F|nr:hypothetical protein [Streptomyces sp. CB02120-2]PJN17383.1 hypothetical protein CG724_17300 [Streptomyces sp. CB02120-2]